MVKDQEIPTSRPEIKVTGDLNDSSQKESKSRIVASDVVQSDLDPVVGNHGQSLNSSHSGKAYNAFFNG